MVNTRMFTNFFDGVLRVAPRTGILVALDLRDKQRHRKLNCNYMREAATLRYTERFKQLYKSLGLEQAVQSGIAKIICKTATTAGYGTSYSKWYKIQAPQQMCCSSTTASFLHAPEQIILEPDRWYIDMYSDDEAREQRVGTLSATIERSVDAEIEAEVEAELPPNVRALVEAQRLQNSLMALMALQQSFANTVEQTVATAKDVQVMHLDTLNNDMDKPESGDTTEISTLHDRYQSLNMSMNYFNCVTPLPQYTKALSYGTLMDISWKSDWQSEALRIVKVCDDFMRDAATRTATIVKKCIDATSDQRIAEVIVKAMQDLGLLMKRIGQAIMDMINRIQDALGHRETNPMAKALLLAQTCANMTKSSADRCKAEAANCKEISNNIMKSADKESKSVLNNISGLFNDFSKTVGNFGVKLDKESLTAMAFAKELMKSK